MLVWSRDPTSGRGSKARTEQCICSCITGCRSNTGEPLFHCELVKHIVPDSATLWIEFQVATTLRGYIHNPAVNRKEIIAAIRRVTEPQPGVYIKALRKAYEVFLADNQLDILLAAVKSIGVESSSSSDSGNAEVKNPVKREDLKLICFDYVSE
jgi:hypothetical protein